MPQIMMSNNALCYINSRNNVLAVMGAKLVKRKPIKIHRDNWYVKLECANKVLTLFHHSPISMLYVPNLHFVECHQLSFMSKLIRGQGKGQRYSEGAGGTQGIVGKEEGSKAQSGRD